MFYQLDINHKFLDAIVHHRLRFDDRWTNWDKVDLQTVQYCCYNITILHKILSIWYRLYPNQWIIFKLWANIDHWYWVFRATILSIHSSHSLQLALVILRIPILDKISIQNESYIWSKVRALQSWQTESFFIIHQWKSLCFDYS